MTPKRRSEIAVEILHTGSLTHEVSVRLDKNYPVKRFELFNTEDVGPQHSWESRQYRLTELVARCESAKRLVDWAFENGAQVVVQAFDGKLSDEEL